MHYFQKIILDRLRTSENLRYSDLMPDGVESGHFRYHLAELVNDGYVESIERGVYRLTTEGQSFVDTLLDRRIHPHAMPKVISYTLLVDGENVVLQRKSKHPYKDMLNMIGGKIHQAEFSSDASIREVAEKTGLKVVNPILRGVFEVFVDAGEKGSSHAIAFVYLVKIDSTTISSSDLVVLNVQELSMRSDLAPDFMPIFGQIFNSTAVVNGSIYV